MKKILVLISFGICLAACQREGTDPFRDPAAAIRLRAGVSPSMETRAAYTNTSPTTEVPLNATVWASTTSSVYENAGKNGSASDLYVVAKHTYARFQSGDTPQLLSEAVYPHNTGDAEPPRVYFVAFAPRSDLGWVDEMADGTSDDSYASYVFDGKSDVLYAPEISGYYGIPLADSPTFHFYHLLTWLKFEIKTDGSTPQEREGVRDAWGKITNLQLKDQKNRITIDLGTPPDVSSASFATRQANVVATTEFTGGPVTMSIYEKDADTVFPPAGGYTLPTSNEWTEVAYVLCAPVVATAQNLEDPLNPVPTYEYTLTLTTEHRTAIDINIDLKLSDGTDPASDYFVGNPAGKQFTISLFFKLGNTIAVTSAVTDWVIGGMGTSPVNED